jgi:hypothetical protein
LCLLVYLSRVSPPAACAFLKVVLELALVSEG